MKAVKLMLIALVILMSACGSSYNYMSLLGNQEWQLKSLSEKGKIIANPGNLPTLKFNDNTQISGLAGCNRFFGKYNIDKKNRITLKVGGVTLMACPDMNFEQKYLSALAQIDRYKIRNEELILRGGDKIIVYTKHKLIGVANDKHGCNASAGYIWSEVRKDCIRLFETGIRMKACGGTSRNLSAFIVFSTDSLRAEVFIPNNTVNPILDRRKLPNGSYAWNQEDDDTLNIRQIDGRWIIEQRGKTIYRQD